MLHDIMLEPIAMVTRCSHRLLNYYILSTTSTERLHYLNLDYEYSSERLPLCIYINQSVGMKSKCVELWPSHSSSALPLSG